MLAEAGEPLILADGTKIDPANGKVIRERTARGGFLAIPSASEAQAIVAKSRRSISELPLAPRQMSGVALVLFYTMWGLNESDIAIAVGNLSIDQVKMIKSLPEYKTLSDDILKNVLEYEANDVRTFFKQNAHKAAEKIIALTEEDGALGLRASQDVLDRSGFRPADVHEHTHKFEDTLKIEYVEKKERSDIPVVDATFEVIEDGNRS